MLNILIMIKMMLFQYLYTDANTLSNNRPNTPDEFKYEYDDQGNWTKKNSIRYCIKSK